MACRLIGDKPLSELKLRCYLLVFEEDTSMEFVSNTK